MSCQSLPPSPIPIFTTVAGFREWRKTAYVENESVGFVATMGALHEGHLSLGQLVTNLRRAIRRSLAENDRTVVSIFVNPAQFAPHEDLATYPSTLPTDLELLDAESLDVSISNLSPRDPVHCQRSSSMITRRPSAIFVPTVQEMYPSGIAQDVDNQKGSFVEVKWYGEQMEGKSRPTFFRGVATIVTKLFNIVEPTRAYFGQKDIQQALLLRRMCRDLLVFHPRPENLRIVPTVRDPKDGLALSSRNAYLSPMGRRMASVLKEALQAAEKAWNEDGLMKGECLRKAAELVEEKKRSMETDTLEAAEGAGVEITLDYVEMNDAQTFEALGFEEKLGKGGATQKRPIILSGALWVDKTRLIDNIILGHSTLVFG